ncbi:hypothetical protein TNCV_4988391 [Trichonephila clavipes]|nr:hypothetical protein TNCV_4988391 [Trichonephila clavipes]
MSMQVKVWAPPNNQSPENLESKALNISKLKWDGVPSFRSHVCACMLAATGRSNFSNTCCKNVRYVLRSTKMAEVMGQ